MFLRNAVILHHCTASQPRRPRLIQVILESEKRNYSFTLSYEFFCANSNAHCIQEVADPVTQGCQTKRQWAPFSGVP
jgi:hypothetical protein